MNGRCNFQRPSVAGWKPKNLDWDSLVTLMMTNNYFFMTILKLLPDIIDIQTVDELEEVLIAFSKMIGRKEIKTLLEQLLPPIIKNIITTYKNIDKFLEMGWNLFITENIEQIEILKILVNIGKVDDNLFTYEEHIFNILAYDKKEFFNNVGYLLYRFIILRELNTSYKNESFKRWETIFLLAPKDFLLYSILESEFERVLNTICDIDSPNFILNDRERINFSNIFYNKIRTIRKIADKYKYFRISELLNRAKHVLNLTIEHGSPCNFMPLFYEDED